MPDDTDASHSSAIDGDRDGETCEDEEEDSDDFDADEGAVIGDRLSSRITSERKKSRGNTKDEPVGSVTPSAGPTMYSGAIPRKRSPPTFRERSRRTPQTSTTRRE